MCLPCEKRRDDKTVLWGLAVDDYQIFSWFDLLGRKQFALIPSENRCRIGDSFYNLGPETRQFTMFFCDMCPSFIREPNRYTVSRVYSLWHAHSLTKDLHLLALDRLAKSDAERYA